MAHGADPSSASSAYAWDRRRSGGLEVEGQHQPAGAGPQGGRVRPCTRCADGRARASTLDRKVGRFLRNLGCSWQSRETIRTARRAVPTLSDAAIVMGGGFSVGPVSRPGAGSDVCLRRPDPSCASLWPIAVPTRSPRTITRTRTRIQPDDPSPLTHDLIHPSVSSATSCENGLGWDPNHARSDPRVHLR